MVEEILELNENNQLTIPASIIQDMHLEPGAHFVARHEMGSFVIEHVPFSSLKQGETLEKTIHSAQKGVKI